MTKYIINSWLEKIDRVQTKMRSVCILTAIVVISTVPHAAEKVSPLFLHGQGLGIIGAPGENSSVFLSEAEGAAIIHEELALAGINADKNDMILADVLPVDSPPPNESLPTPKRSLALDGYDAKALIAFEYISFHDANAFRKKNSGMPGETINMLACAQFTQQSLLTVNLDFRLAIFYDPALKLADAPAELLDDPTRTPANIMQQQARELLRQQVRDFLTMAELPPLATENE